MASCGSASPKREESAAHERTTGRQDRDRDGRRLAGSGPRERQGDGHPLRSGGGKVLCADQAKERAEETVGVIRGEGGEASAFVADVTHAAECEAMVRSAVERWGGLDILHNNVGIESRKDLLETPEDEWDRVIAVDLKSMFLAT